MCDPYSIGAVAAAVISAGVSYAGQQKQAKAANAMADLENQRQQRYQQNQARLIAQQEKEKEKGRQAYDELQPQLGREETDADQAAAALARDEAYQQALSPVFQQGADPTQQTAAEVKTVSDAPIAVQNAMDKEQARAFNFSTGQAKARSFLDAMGDTQRMAHTKLARGSQEIAKYGDFVSGLNKPLTGYGGLKDSSTTLYNQGLSAAQGEGAGLQALGSLIGSINQLGYGYATTRQPANVSTISGIQGTPGTTSARPILVS